MRKTHEEKVAELYYLRDRYLVLWGSAGTLIEAETMALDHTRIIGPVVDLIDREATG